jgi:hypothetical protein
MALYNYNTTIINSSDRMGKTRSRTSWKGKTPTQITTIKKNAISIIKLTTTLNCPDL